MWISERATAYSTILISKTSQEIDHFEEVIHPKQQQKQGFHL